MNQRRIELRAVCLAGAVLAAIGAGASAWAQDGDAVHLGGFWIEGVTVETIRHGQIEYETRGGTRVVRPLEAVGGLRLGRYPALSEAAEAQQRGDLAETIEKLRGVRQAAEQAWVRQYAGWRLWRALAERGEALGAIRVYAELAGEGAEPHYLTEPPLDATAMLDGEARAAALAALRAAATRADEVRRPFVTALLEAVDPGASGARPRPAVGEAGAGELGASSGGEGDDAGVSAEAIELPGGLLVASGVGADPVRELLSRGAWSQASAEVDRLLAEPGGLSRELYLKGLIALARAERHGDEALYKEAGLWFMRVVIHFPRSAVVGPALVEAGYVHQRIGRPRIAASLFDEARAHVDPKRHPQYHARLTALAGQAATP